MRVRIVVMKIKVGKSTSPEMLARLDAAGEELTSNDLLEFDGSLMGDFAARLEDLVQLCHRAKACGGKESEDEE